jgi:hypothetical protein
MNRQPFAKIANIAVWVAAAIMALYLGVTSYIDTNPFPKDAPDSTSVSVPAVK